MELTGQWISPSVVLANNAANVAYVDVSVYLSRCTPATPTYWDDPACFVQVNLECSTDGETTWMMMGGWGAYGGLYVRRDGVTAVESSGQFRVFNVNNRRMRLVITPSLPTHTVGRLTGVLQLKNGTTTTVALAQFL